MNSKNFLLIFIFSLLVNCSVDHFSMNKQDTYIEKGFSNKGFALIYNQKYYDDGLISKRIDERSLVIFQKNLKINTQVKIKNISNNKSLIAIVGESSNYPSFNNSVISRRVAEELDLDVKDTYIEIIEIMKNSIFIAKKAKTYEEEKNVAKKVPVNSISINDLNNIKVSNTKILKKKFSYEIKIADFFFNDGARLMIDRIVNETNVEKPKIKKINNEKYRVYLGPFNNINSLQKSFNDISILEFENIEIIRND